MQANMSTESIDHVAIQFEKAVTITDSLELPKCKNGKSLSLVRESSSSSVRSLDLSEVGCKCLMTNRMLCECGFARGTKRYFVGFDTGRKSEHLFGSFVFDTCPSFRRLL
eukprot:comp20421_c0_seq3/m.25900 comp20421_c0_seq3/g.25900  ORF comp20421_c0_seq3/g.25900 comp20421_c0_seq3/m.25900 type:complete len:110 (-) comp20421_c0_seq3:123-452(-)